MKTKIQKSLIACSMMAAILTSPRQAHAGVGYDNAFDNPFFVSSSLTLLPFLVTAISDQLDHLKITLAQQVSEDAAVFYQTGNLTGVLSGVLNTYRESTPGAADLSDLDAINRMLDEAEEVLSRTTLAESM